MHRHRQWLSRLPRGRSHRATCPARLAPLRPRRLRPAEVEVEGGWPRVGSAAPPGCPPGCSPRFVGLVRRAPPAVVAAAPRRRPLSSAPRRDDGGGGGIGIDRHHPADYARAGGFDQSACSLTEDEVRALIRERTRCRRARNFDEADRIKRRLEDCGIALYDKSRRWSVVSTASGHGLTRAGGPVDPAVCALDEGRIDALLRERARLRRAGSFEEADGIRSDLRRAGVWVDDKRGEWRADGLGPSVPTRAGADADDESNGNGRVHEEAGARADGSIAPPRDDVHRLPRERTRARPAGEFERADEIRHRPRDEGAFADEKSKTRRADGTDEERTLPSAFPPAPSRSNPGAKDREAIEGTIAPSVDDAGSRRNRRVAAFWAALPRLLDEYLQRPAREAPAWPRQLGKMLSLTVESVGSFSPQELSATALSLARIANKVRSGKHRGEDFPKKSPHAKLHRMLSDPETRDRVFERIASAAAGSIEEFDAQCLSNLAYACAVADHAPEADGGDSFFDRVAERSIALLGTFKPQELSNLLWTYARLGAPHPDLFRKTGDAVASLDGLQSFTGQALSNLVWSYAAAKERHPELFQKVADHILSLESWGNSVGRQGEFNARGVANFLWAYATNGHDAERQFSSLAQFVGRLLGSCNSQELANVAWAYSVANVEAPSVFNDAFVGVCLAKEDEFHIESLSQLHQWQLWQEELGSDIELPPSLKEKCHEAFILRGSKRSSIQDDVISELFSIGLRPEVERLTGRGYIVDALVEVNGKNVAVEVDSPSHFVGRRPAGKTILKQRQVAKLEGIRVASVPYWEWGELGEDRDKKQVYLQLLLDLF